tara:strand:+ start:250 stop:735 length:486 start_codon:yes stop_codon:yes gene_type:complete
MQGNIPNPKSAVILGLTANYTLSAATLTAAAVDWDRVVPKKPDGNEELPDWLTSYGTAIEFAQTGLYLVSWVIDWTANGSGQDHAKSYLSHFQASTGVYSDFGNPTFAAEDTGISDALVHPATPFELDGGDKINIVVARVAGASSSGWTARGTSFVNIVKL